MINSTDADELVKPALLERRWREIKTAIFKLVQAHQREELLQALLRLRENHTSAPTLSEITNFTGFDVAIHSIQRWDWEPSADGRSLESDVVEIGKYGAELMMVHTLRESIRNELLIWDGKKLLETSRGVKHFQTLNSFNVDITGSRMDVTRKRFSQGRLTKHQRKMDPVNKLNSVKRLYWENSILMLLRSPLPFYRAMQILTVEQQRNMIDLHSKLVKKSTKQSDGIVTIRISNDTKIAKVLNLLTPPLDKTDRRPRFVACLKLDENDDKIIFQIGLGALTMFIMFLLGFERDHLDDKAQRAEKAVCEVIEASGYWNVVESNIDVIREGGEVITEIDIIARSKINPIKWITLEVKDFSFWRGWVWGQGSKLRETYYKNAISKLPVKEEFICQKHSCEEVLSFIVTSIPEPFESLNETKLIYLSNLSEELAKLSGHNFTPRKRHKSSNFLIRYFERLQKDYQNADRLEHPKLELIKQIEELKDKLEVSRDDYENVRNTFNIINSEYETLQVSKRLATKRLVKDSGDRHFQIEKELQDIENMITKAIREKKVKATILRELKEKYTKILKKIKNVEVEYNKLLRSSERLLTSRLF